MYIIEKMQVLFLSSTLMYLLFFDIFRALLSSKKCCIIYLILVRNSEIRFSSVVILVCRKFCTEFERSGIKRCRDN